MRKVLLIFPKKEKVDISCAGRTNSAASLDFSVDGTAEPLAERDQGTTTVLFTPDDNYCVPSI